MAKGDGDGLIVEVDNPYDYDFEPLTDEQNRAIQRAIARDRRRALTQEAARQIGVVRAMQAKGLSVKTAVITGVTVQFGQPDAALPASDNELDKWLLRHPEYARSPERH